MKFAWRKYVIVLSVFTLILGGCSQSMNVSAEEIIQNAIESEKDIAKYIGTSEMKLFEGEKVVEHAIIKEFVDGAQRKVITTDQLLGQEMVALNDGETMIMYDEAIGEAHEMNLGELGDLAAMNPKEQFKQLMELVKDSHTYELVGEEKLLDMDTYHIKMKANEADGLLGDIELWVDQKTWFIVKFESESGEYRTELTYSELDFSPKFADDTFTLDIPDDVEISDLEEEFSPDDVTLEEATETLGQPFLVFSEENATLTSSQIYDFSEQLQRHEVELNYSSADGIPLATLSIFPSPEDMEIAESDVEIRGNAAEYEEMINAYFWDEDGLRYSLIVTNPDIEQDEILKMTDNMIPSTEQ